MSDWHERFWSKVDKREPAECWNWTGAISKNGYGSFKLNRQSVTSSRIAYELDRGEPPSNCMILHTCDNRACCNPGHLYLGDVKQNSKDMVERGRWGGSNQRGSQNNAAKLTEQAVASIRSQIAAGRPNTLIARDFSVTHQMISKIRRGHFWTHVPDNGGETGGHFGGDR